MTDIKSNRLNILTNTEERSLYSTPIFNNEQQEHYFSLSKQENVLIKPLAYSSKIYFVLINGYFKAKHLFFNITINESMEDINYIIQKIFKQRALSNEFKLPSPRTQYSIRQMVLEINQFQNISSTDKNKISKHATHLVQQYNKPKDIFYGLVKYIERDRRIIPAYSMMQDIVGEAISTEQFRLSSKLSRLLSNKNQASLDGLLATEESLYGITALKKDMKNFNYNQIKKEIIKRDKYYDLYLITKSLLPKLNISKGNIAYYASLAHYHSVYKLRRLPKEQAYLYLICYIYHRTQKINDNLVQSFIYQVSKFYNEAISYGRKEYLIYKDRIHYEKEKLGIILSYFADQSLQRYKFSTVVKKAYKIMPKETLIKISELFKNQEKKEIGYRWEYFVSKKQSISLNVKPLFMAINFDCDEENNSVMQATHMLKEFFKNKLPLSKLDLTLFPDELIPKNIQEHLLDNDGINPCKYIFLIYYRLMRYINNNKSFINDSVSFKSFEEDVKIVHNWEQEKKSILNRLSLPKLDTPLKERLNVLEDELEAAYKNVNNRIINGDNSDVNLKEDGESWTINYPKSDKEAFNHKFYNKLTQKSISDVFDFVESKCKFINLFEHKLQRYIKKKDHYQWTKACIIANATRQGIYNMARASNLNYEQLRQTELDRLRIETLKAACDKISQSIEKLELFHRRNIYTNGYYASIDGSKHITRRDTLKSRYSKKYFGLEKGIVSLNMVVNEVPVNCEIISANEYEGHYLYDLYHSNTSGLDPSIISTDTAGSNLVNFSLLDTIDVTYAPAYKSMFDRARGLCGFSPLDSYSDMIIKPNKVVERELILQQEDEIKKIFSALYLNETSQHIVVKKICCRERQTLIKKALWAYNDVFFSLYFLKYVDSSSLKRMVRKSLNRGELYNKLFNTVSSIGGKKFRGLTELELQVWDHCTRLITLVILYYNFYLLSFSLRRREMCNDDKAIKKLCDISPAATQHINLSGEYHYSPQLKPLNIAGLIEEIDGFLDS